MKTFVGVVSALIMSGGMGLLVYFTFRSDRPIDPSRHVATNRAPQADGEDDDGSTTGSAHSSQAEQMGRTDEHRAPDRPAS